jgi:DNA-binding CsgD family transcriptional regulator
MTGYHHYRLPTAPDEPTPRQIEVMQAICDGHIENAQIAAALGIHYRTVDTHLHLLCERIGARNKYHALVLMWQMGYVTIEGAD